MSDQSNSNINTFSIADAYVHNYADYEKKSRESWWMSIPDKELCFSYDVFTDDQIRYLIQDPTIVSLDVSMCDTITPLQVEYLLSSSSILHLNLSDVGLNDNLISKLSNSNLISLEIHFFDNALSLVGFSQTKFSILDLSDSRYDNPDDIKYLASNTSLTCLNLMRFSYGDEESDGTHIIYRQISEEKTRACHYQHFKTNLTLERFSDDYGTLDVMNAYRSEIYDAIDGELGLKYEFPKEIVHIIFSYCVAGYVGEF